MLPRVRDVLSRQVGHLRRLVDDLLDVGRIVGGKVRLDLEPVCLQAIVADAVESIASEVDARGHVLSQDLADEPLWVQGDRLRLVQVLANLLHNAAKFTPDGGRIEVGLHRDWDKGVLSVTDNGRGIPRERLKHVFKMFAQGDDDHASRQHGGLGIGLSLVHQMVTQHGGEVSAFSRGEPGMGTQFQVCLPLVRPPPGAAPG